MRTARWETYNGYQWVDHYGLDHLGNTRYIYTLTGDEQSDFYPLAIPILTNSPPKNATRNPASTISVLASTHQPQAASYPPIGVTCHMLFRMLIWKNHNL